MSQGKIFYGLHMYPGVARYVPEKGDPFQVLIKDQTIRNMGPSFAGRPVYVQHVDEVPDNVDDMRREADGIVIESFFNTADGNHWTKFVVLSEDAERAISQGYRLSNCYKPKRFANGGRWNGLTYDREVTAGEYDHLAIVSDPRYEESMILTPEQFKSYNETKLSELQRLANSNSKEGEEMKFKFFKRAKIDKLENAADLAEAMVELPTLRREVSIQKLLNEVDTGEFLVDIDGRQVSITDLVKEHKQVTADFAELKKLQNESDDDDKCANGDDDDEIENADEDGDGDDDEDDEEIRKRRKKVDDDNVKNKKKNGKKMKNSRADDGDADVDLEDQESIIEHLENSSDDGRSRRKSEGKDRADRLRNARDRSREIELPGVDTGISCDMVEIGKQRYGSTPKAK